DDVLRNIERIARIASRMSGRSIECVEIVIRRLNLRAFLDGIAHGDEDVLDFLPHDRQRMSMSDPSMVSGKGDVDRFAKQCGIFLAFENGDLERIQLRFNVGFDKIGDASELGSVGGGQIPQALKLESEQSGLAGE